MGFMDLFRKKLGPVKEISTLSLEEAKMALKDELKIQENQLVEVKGRAVKRIEDFVSDLKNHVKILKSINLENRKEDERVKSIVLLSLREYIEQVERLIDDLERIDESKKGLIYFKKIDLAIDFFFKNSRKKLDKANYLIGKELKELENVVRIFCEDIKNFLGEAKRVSSKLDYIDAVNDLKEAHLKLERALETIKKEISNLQKQEEKFSKEEIDCAKQIKEFREGNKFKEWLLKKENLRKEKRFFLIEIDKLKEKINLKSLLRDYHSIKGKRELIKNYIDNFLGSLEEDSSLEIIEMLDSGVKEDLGIQIKTLAEKNLILRKEEKNYGTNKTLGDLEERLVKTKEKIREIKERFEKEIGKSERFESKRELAQKEIIEVLEKILDDVEIIPSK